MSHFKNWTQAQVEAHNAKLAKVKPQQLEVGKGGIQDEIETWLKSLGNRAAWIRTRTDKPHTMAVGTPDFIGGLRVPVIQGQMDDQAAETRLVSFALEVKRPGKKPTIEQLGQLRRWQLIGYRTAVVHSLDEAKDVLKV